jgi:hypothetical protein
MENQSKDKKGHSFVFDQKYFTDPSFKKRFDRDIKMLRAMIRHGKNQDFCRGSLNAFMTACFKMISDEETRTYIHLEFYQTLGHYAEIYSSEQTFRNVIADFEKPEMRAKLFGKHPMRSYIIYGEVLLKYYGLKNEESKGWYTQEGFEIITKAKYFILKAYIQAVEGKNKFNKSDQSYCLVLLAACFMHLSRWFEPIYYLRLLKEKDIDDPNYPYLTSLTLEALMEKSCLDYNGQLFLKIVECANKVETNAYAEDRQKEHAKELMAKAMQNIRTAKLSIDKLKKHKSKIETSRRKRNQYFKYCVENDLFLNEHAMFCTCGRSIGDTLEIKTQHSHTELEWVKKFERLLDLLISDFSLARGDLYQAESPRAPVLHYRKENLRKTAEKLKKDSLLKNTFKICYSILDQICHGIFEVLEIDIESYLKANSVGKPVPHIYFLNMWDLHPFSQEALRNNLYLISLYSIAKDLDRTEYAALKSFKDYRNAMEHKFLFIEDSEVLLPQGLNYSKKIKRVELLAKTKLLMILTKSAILSFTYLVRRQSKIKEMAHEATTDARTENNEK